MKGGYILFNGKFFRETDPLFIAADIYRLHSCIRESFRTENNQVMFAEDMFNYLVNALLSFGLPFPYEWDLPRFKGDISRLLNKNHYFLATKVVFHLIPGVLGTDFLITAEEATPGFYPINEAGLLIEFYHEGLKVSSSVQSYEPSSRLLWTLATRSALSGSKENLILSNSKGFACESIGGSFGYLANESAIFPSPESQGYIPPILGVVMECAEKCGYNIIEKNEISRDDLLKADELFLIDNCVGIQPVLGLNTRRYYMNGTIAIATKLSETARKEHPSI